MSVYITRHGQTNWNIERRFQGRTDNELNENGIKQAHEVAEKLANEPLDLIICSPLIRAKQTAEIFNEKRGIEIIFDNNLLERDYGELEGCYLKDYDFKNIWSYDNSQICNLGESVKDLFKRVYDFLDKLKKEYPNKNILLVAHGGISIAVNCYFNGIPEDGEILKTGLGNCEYAKYDFI
jgi:broad specificity phosphatase PhoE